MPYRRPPRVPGFDYLGQYAYFLTLCTSGRARLFTRSDLVEAVMLHLHHAALQHRFALLAYCFMPDHLHLLVQGQSEDSDLRRFVVCVKQQAAYHTRNLRQGDLWQEGYHDHVLRSDERIEAIVRYILDNPVRAGLVAKVEDYPYSGTSLGTAQKSLEGLA